MGAAELVSVLSLAAIACILLRIAYVILTCLLRVAFGRSKRMPPKPPRPDPRYDPRQFRR